MNEYRVTVQHDHGTSTLRTTARNWEAACHQVMEAEGCPKSAILSIQGIYTPELKHTPGPWTTAYTLQNFETDPELAIWANVGSADERVICLITPHSCEDDEDHLNARLIEAAPEMAKVLQECITAYEEHRQGQPTGHLWPDPNHIFHAKQLLQQIANQDTTNQHVNPGPSDTRSNAVVSDLRFALEFAHQIIERLASDFATFAGRHANYTKGEAKVIESAIAKARGLHKEVPTLPKEHKPLNAVGHNAWDCPKSPDGKCHYYTNDKGLVVLYTGEDVAPPAGHDPDGENEDECIYCGLPEERK